ncbi:MAG: S46 family peptidase [Acidobacteria bacterium]|nr:MAG: S46 family peptidase [Acidobacteriota bacterium]
MQSITRLLTIAVLFISAGSFLVADEGMWMPQQIPDLAPKLKAMGFTGNPAAFADLTGHPMGAVVSLGGCSASFISPEGLIVTNHHCAVGALQYNSTPQKNLLVDGFLAKTRDEEISNGPGARVYVTQSVKDVTEAITGQIDPKLDDRQRHDLTDRRIKERTAACEAGGLRCRVASFFGGHKYYEIAQLEIQDVRTVYAPAVGIGNFGGETDNWRWPRHTGDWSFFRAYVGKDGKPAPYSKDNVPFKPRQILKIQPAGVKSGDLVFVVGYPGRTQRHQTYEEVKLTTEWTFPRTIKNYQDQIAILEEIGKQDKELQIKAASRLRGLNNTLTNRRGMLEGLVKGGILAQKQKAQKDLETWIAADPARAKQFGDVLPALRALQAEIEKTRERDAVFAQLFSSSTLLTSAQSAYLLSIEKAKANDMDRESSYQQRDWSRIREGQERIQRTLDARLDRVLLRYALGLAAELPADQRIAPLDKAAGLTPGMAKSDAAKAIDSYLDKLYAGTKMADRDYRLALFDKPTSEILATKDSFVELAYALDPMYQAERVADKKRQGADSRLRPRYMQALLQKEGGLVAPDANSTLRVTFGQIKGVDSKDGLYWKPFTTLAGIEQKHTGEGEFDAPARELAAIKAFRGGKKTPFLHPEVGDVPVDFLSSVDTTGGNSGSPTLNGKGELVGLLFDGTFDTIASDFLYDKVRTRSIHVDFRYALWVMSEVDGAGHLLKEMGVLD